MRCRCPGLWHRRKTPPVGAFRERPARDRRGKPPRRHRRSCAGGSEGTRFSGLPVIIFVSPGTFKRRDVPKILVSGRNARQGIRQPHLRGSRGFRDVRHRRGLVSGRPAPPWSGVRLPATRGTGFWCPATGHCTERDGCRQRGCGKAGRRLAISESSRRRGAGSGSGDR
jgi:hypothetical protein